MPYSDYDPDASYSWEHSYNYESESLHDQIRRIQPLLDQIERFDTALNQLADQGGKFADLIQISDMLAAPFSVETRRFRSRDTLSLNNQKGIQRFLGDLSYGRIHLQVRRVRLWGLPFPSYYLCVLRHNYWGTHSLIVQDLYRSARYPMHSPYFVRLMDQGREQFMLRLSPFREQTKALIASGPKYEPPSNRHDGYKTWRSSGRDSVDGLLERVGRHVLTHMWSEDHEIPFLFAEHFDIAALKQALELLYFCLGADLSHVRNIADPTLLAFFETAYPHPPVYRFLEEVLPGLDGIALNRLSEVSGRRWYHELMSAFQRFLQQDVSWTAQVRLPLYKVTFSNLSRMDQIREALHGQKHVHEKALKLETEARRIIDAVLASGASS